MADISANQNFDDTGKAVTYKVLDFRSINYGLGTIDSSQVAKQKFLGHRWAFTLESPPLLRSEAFELISSAGGQIAPPIISNTSGTASGTVTVQLLSSTSPAYNYTKGSRTIPVAGGSGTLKKGDFVRFSDHTKIYQLTADTNLDGSSIDTISIFPSLRQTLTSTTVGYNDVKWTVINTSDGTEISTNENGYFEFSIDFEEVIA